MPEIPLGSVDRLIRSCGVKRVNTETSEELRKILEEMSQEIIEIAKSIVENRNKKVISKEDVKLAYKFFKEK